ncbi:MAG TPA: prepilin-type N-terminal cleavage/methylation domain-containing protein [Kofleriaceae bacterium]|jgi:prepilin-type N-terminal cleavage/methylation domain-containing protein|nr:prepilin-type N-terminal cleavage/methylation domain-containing protein [Kofleriaceae bacterium]
MFRTLTTRRARNRRRRSLGMTLLEIMIVLAILALVMGLLVGPALFKSFSQSRTEIAHSTTRKLANEAYPQYALKPSNAGKCPTLAELGEYANGNIKDPWGEEYQFRCTDLPPGASGIAVWSKGENKKDEQGEGDDLASWK